MPASCSPGRRRRRRGGRRRSARASRGTDGGTAGLHAEVWSATMSSEADHASPSPFDGTATIGSSCSLSTTDVGRPDSRRGRRRTRSASRAAAWRLPRWKRAEILDTAAAPARRAARRSFARTIAAEAAKPIRTARAEAQRAVGTFQFAAAEARTFAGEIVPLDAIPAGEGKLGFAHARPDRRRRGDLAVQLPAQPRRPQAGPGDRRRLPGGAQAGVSQTPLSRRSPSPRCSSTSAACPPSACTSSPAAAARSATPSSTTPTSP